MTIVSTLFLATALPGPALRGEGPYALVLGTAQDGGIPHLGGVAAPDEAARRDPAARRLVASLLLCDPATGGRWLIDATPDVVAQLDRATGHPPQRKREGARPPVVDGVLLTHAHMGHYLGLAHFGREAFAANALPLHVSPRMAGFLKSNAPWELLVRLGNVALTPFTEGKAIRLAPGLEVVPFAVPHRAEYTDTHGFWIRGPRRSLLYLPDIDKWERWETPIEQWIQRSDVVLLDGTFFSEGELPGRSIAEVPHPFIVESLARFAKLRASERRKIRFTHLNHTNPAALPNTQERRAIETAGMAVAAEGERIELGETKKAAGPEGTSPASQLRRSLDGGAAEAPAFAGKLVRFLHWITAPIRTGRTPPGW
jgi:pyrroloquinoline quinone biosynthesis protein B